MVDRRAISGYTGTGRIIKKGFKEWFLEKDGTCLHFVIQQNLGYYSSHLHCMMQGKKAEYWKERLRPDYFVWLTGTLNYTSRYRNHTCWIKHLYIIDDSGDDKLKKRAEKYDLENGNPFEEINRSDNKKKKKKKEVELPEEKVVDSDDIKKL